MASSPPPPGFPFATVISAHRPFDSIEQAAAGAFDTFEQASSRCGGGCAGHCGDADRLAVGVAAVVFGDGVFGVAWVIVGNECGACGSVHAVIHELDGDDWADAFEEFLRTLGRHNLHSGHHTHAEIGLGQLVVDVVDSELCAAAVLAFS